MKNNAVILDPCCGSKMFWFDKDNPNVIFGDIRKKKYILCDGRKLNISPDIVMDFTKMNFPDKRFKLIVFDPPHLCTLGKNSWMAKKYGILDKANWQSIIKNGFNECWRVLENDGIIIFKWSDVDIKVSDVIKLLNKRPLFGHTIRKKNRTIWMCFMKLTPKGQHE